jgi:hypothetical protein
MDMETGDLNRIAALGREAAGARSILNQPALPAV